MKIKQLQEWCSRQNPNHEFVVHPPLSDELGFRMSIMPKEEMLEAQGGWTTLVEGDVLENRGDELLRWLYGTNKLTELLVEFVEDRGDATWARQTLQ